MKQRVGFARALVSEPEMLFLDEPFSALDVLAAENLRGDLLDLWLARKIPTRAILMITHNIDEAVTLADRLLIFSANPGRIRAELPGLPLAERLSKGQTHAELVDTIYRIMTNPREEIERLLPQARILQRPAAPTSLVLPHADVGELTGFLERLTALGGREDLFELARDLQLEADELLPLVEAAQLLEFVRVEEGDIVLTETGRTFATADLLQRKELSWRNGSSGFGRSCGHSASLHGTVRQRIGSYAVWRSTSVQRKPDGNSKQLSSGDGMRNSSPTTSILGSSIRGERSMTRRR